MLSDFDRGKEAVLRCMRFYRDQERKQAKALWKEGFPGKAEGPRRRAEWLDSIIKAARVLQDQKKQSPLPARSAESKDVP